MHIVLFDRDPAVVQAFERIFRGFGEGVHHHIVIEGNVLTSPPVDAVVSPANSFGFMDGGIDAAYSTMWPGIQERVQKAIQIQRRPFRELLVGEALVVETGDAWIPHLIVAPTMRVPMPIRDPADVYLATRAAVWLAMGYRFETVAFPGMGTGVGRVMPEEAARQMRKGIERGLTGEQFPTSWQAAREDHLMLHKADIRQMGGQKPEPKQLSD